MNIKKYIIILFLIIITSTVFSEEYEFEKYKLPTESDLIAVKFHNKYNGIIVSNTAEIFYTNDGGQEWKESDFKLDFIPNSLIFLANGEAVIVGSKETIIKTYDYGKKWLVLSHADTSIVVFKNVISRSPYEIFITEEKTKVLHFTLDGFKTMKINVIENISDILTTPILYNPIDDNIYLPGKFTKSSIPGPTPNYNYTYNRFVTKYFNTVKGKGITSEPSPNDTYIANLSIISMINGEVVGSSGNYIEKFNLQTSENKFVFKNEHKITHISDFNNTGVLLDEKGNVVFLEDFYYDNTRSRKANFNVKTVPVTDTILYDYFQIKDNRGIVASVNGKYFMYDRSGVIDSANTNDISDTIPEFGDLDSDTSGKSEIFNIYPNPTFDKVSVLFDKTIFIQSIELFELTGYSVFLTEIKKELSSYIIDISNLQSGNYFLKIITEEGEIYKKIVKF